MTTTVPDRQELQRLQEAKVAAEQTAIFTEKHARVLHDCLMIELITHHIHRNNSRTPDKQVDIHCEQSVGMYRRLSLLDNRNDGRFPRTDDAKRNRERFRASLTRSISWIDYDEMMTHAIRNWRLLVLGWDRSGLQTVDPHVQKCVEFHVRIQS
jgi:hypothetical protein